MVNFKVEFSKFEVLGYDILGWANFNKNFTSNQILHVVEGLGNTYNNSDLFIFLCFYLCILTLHYQHIFC